MKSSSIQATQKLKIGVTAVRSFSGGRVVCRWQERTDKNKKRKEQKANETINETKSVKKVKLKNMPTKTQL